MAVVFMEGFDHLSGSQLTAKGWSANPNSMQTGRFSGQCARITGSGVAAIRTLPSTYSTLIVGYAFRFNSLSQNSGRDHVTLRAVTTDAVRISTDASGHLVVKNSGGTTIATGTTALNIATWYYIEVKAVINGASGSVTVNLNGAAEITVTTGNFGSTNLDHIQITSGGGTVQNDWDDMYAVDTTGASPRNTFLGDVRVSTIMPTADGAHSAWTPSSGTNHFDRVNETTPDDDTTYLSDSTPNDIDTWAYADIDGAATVYGVQVNTYARKDDAGTRQIAPVIRQSGSDNVGTTVTMASTYSVYSQIYNQDPTSADWTPTTVNADEFGVKEIA